MACSLEMCKHPSNALSRLGTLYASRLHRIMHCARLYTDGGRLEVEGQTSAYSLVGRPATRYTGLSGSVPPHLQAELHRARG
jgi:hypothetical protein